MLAYWLWCHPVPKEASRLASNVATLSLPLEKSSKAGQSVPKDASSDEIQCKGICQPCAFGKGLGQGAQMEGTHGKRFCSLWGGLTGFQGYASCLQPPVEVLCQNSRNPRPTKGILSIKLPILLTFPAAEKESRQGPTKESSKVYERGCNQESS